MVTIFIRTFKRDIVWLDYCLQSIHKNLKGWDEIILCIPENQARHLAHVKDTKIILSPVFKDDYIGQQVSKLLAYQHTTSDYILFVDSDLVFLPGADVNDLIHEGLPVIGKEPYSQPKYPAVRKWQPIVEKLFREKPEWEYMGLNASSRLFHRSTLANFHQHFPDIVEYARRQPKHKFSEFNFLGFFAEKFEPQKYCFMDIHHEKIPAIKARQFWSWGGVTPEISRELKALGFEQKWPNTLNWYDLSLKKLDETNRNIKQWIKSFKN